MKKQSTLIIKKVRKSGHGGAHGGSWKVAYADFVTAMMAFFLLLWLVSMVSPEKRARVSAYFKHFSIYDQGGTSFMDKSSEMFNESGESSQKALQELIAQNIENTENKLQEGIMGKLGDAKDQVMVDTVDGGIRIEITDKDGSFMFERGSNRMTAKAREILHVIYNNIKKLPYKLAIEGHTDSLQYSGSAYSNWELSTERASAARRELEANGLESERIVQVSGFADKNPLITQDLSDPKNRRISIILKGPYIDESIIANSNGNNTDLNSSGDPVEEKDNDSLIVNKFEENLSLINKGMNDAEKKSGESNAKVKTESAPVETKDSMSPDNKKFGLVIKRDEWSPVIKDEFSPVIKNNSSVKTDNSNPYLDQNDSKTILKNIQIPDYSNTILINIPIPVIKKATPAPDIKQSEKYPVEIKDSMSPDNKNFGLVIKRDEWNPVIKDEFSPVIKNNSSVKKDNFNPVSKPDNIKPVLKNIQIPVITKNTSKPVIKQDEKSSYDYLVNTSRTNKKEDKKALRNETVPVLNEENKEAGKTPSIIKELSSPVISTDDLFKK